jgi:hypothetical protein
LPERGPSRSPHRDGVSLGFVDTPPTGYTPPVLVYLVEYANQPGDDVPWKQVGGFFAKREAETLLEELTAEGWPHVRINMVAIHQRAVDYDYDR